MRLLDPDLTAAQKLAPLIDYPSLMGNPALKVEITNKRGAATFASWTRYYTGAETNLFNACAVPSDGSLNRFYTNGIDWHLHRQRVTTPGTGSDYTSWTDTGLPSGAIGACYYGTNIIVAFADPLTPFHISIIKSADSGATWSGATDLGFVTDTNGRIAIAAKSDGTILLVYTRANAVYTAKRSSGTWSAERSSGKSLSAISGIAVCYQGDWNIVATGVDASAQDGVWTIVCGDDYSEAVDSWSDFAELVLREAGEDFEYYAPAIDFPDVFRIWFVERHTGTVSGNRQYWTHAGPTTDFISNLWLEPVPFNFDSQWGVSIHHKSNDVWLCSANGVWYADLTPVTVTITSDVVEVSQKLKPGLSRSSLTVVLDNTAGTYNDFASKGWQVSVSLGYMTASGLKYSACPYFWITGWEFVSPPWFPLRAFFPSGVIGTLKIYCEGAWELLDRWRARKKYSWEVGNKSIFQLVNWVICRAGLEHSSYSYSDAMVNYKPEFEIPAGYTGKWALKKLLGWVEDVPVISGHTVYTKLPAAADASNYTYDSIWGVSHLVYRGNYGVGMWKPNIAQIDTDLLHVEQFAWDEIAEHYDRMTRATQPEYTSEADASRRGTRELRRGEIWTGYTGWCQVPTNCGQEEFDVITITDVAAGVNAIKRRVLGIETTWKMLDGSYYQKLLLGAV